MKLVRDFGRILVALVAASFGGGCVATDPVPTFAETNLVWPEPPEQARIAYVGEFATLADFGIRPSFWGRVLGAAAGPATAGMVRPMAVVATHDSSIIFVADPDAHCVHRFDLQRRRYACLTPRGGEETASPVGMALAPDGRLFVSDSVKAKIFRADINGRWLEPVIGRHGLKQPTGIVWDELDQLLFVSDTGDHTIKVLTPDGKLIRTFGRRGNQSGELNFPTYLSIGVNREVLVADSLNFRVQTFDLAGTYLDKFGENGDRPGDFARPKGVAADQFGHVYVVDTLMHLLQIFTAQGELLMALGGQGQGPGQFWLPNGLFITADNTIFVADSYNKRIQVFRYVGPES